MKVLPHFLLVLAILSGCSSEIPIRRVGEEETNRIRTKPDEDILEKAFANANTTVEEALTGIGADIERNSAGQIVSVDLSGLDVTETGIRRLASLKESLTILNANDVYLTDEGLRSISELSNLTHLELNRTPITDAGLEHLKNLQNLKELYLSETDLTDDCLDQLLHCTRLEQLSLAGTKIAGLDFERFSQLRSLNTLILDRTSIGDNSLNFLEKCTKLKFLYVRGTNVTQQSVELWSRQLPTLKIVGP